MPLNQSNLNAAIKSYSNRLTTLATLQKHDDAAATAAKFAAQVAAENANALIDVETIATALGYDPKPALAAVAAAQATAAVQPAAVTAGK